MYKVVILYGLGDKGNKKSLYLFRTDAVWGKVISLNPRIQNPWQLKAHSAA